MEVSDALVTWLRARLDEDELWAKAASAGLKADDGTVPGGVHWTWAIGDQWEPVQPDPLEPYMGGHDGQWSQPVVLRTVEEWRLDWGGPDNTLPVKIAESEELRTADGAHIARHDPARVLREVEAKRRIVDVAGRRLDRYIGTGAQVAFEWLTLRLLALPYDDRDGYREEWRP